MASWKTSSIQLVENKCINFYDKRLNLIIVYLKQILFIGTIKEILPFHLCVTEKNASY